MSLKPLVNASLPCLSEAAAAEGARGLAETSSVCQSSVITNVDLLKILVASRVFRLSIARHCRPKHNIISTGHYAMLK